MASPTTQRLQILIAALLFSTGGTAIKFASLSAWQIASFRSGLAAAALWLVLPSWRKGWTTRTFVVGLAYAGTMIGYVAANKLTTAANTIFLQSTAAMHLLWLGPLVLKEPLRRSDLVYAATVAVGMVLLFVGIEPPRSTAPDPALGNVIGAATGVCWALTILGLRWLGRTETVPGRDPAGGAVVAGNLLAFLICLPLALPVTAHEPRDWLIVVYLGAFQIGLAYVFMTRGVKGVPALETSLLLLLEPVLSAFLAAAAHGEIPGTWSLAGCSILLVATIVKTLARR